MKPTAELSATPAALAELESLRARHGPLMLVQSGGCCDGSSPLCLERGELLVGPNDLLLGDLDGTPFYIDAEQYERWNRPTFQLDLAGGGTDTFSLENADGVHFLTRTLACDAGQENEKPRFRAFSLAAQIRHPDRTAQPP